MALTIKQTDINRFERLVAKLTKSSENPMICFIPSNGGTLKLCAFAKDAVLTMTVSKQGFVDPFAISAVSLKTLAAKKGSDIILTPQKDAVHVQQGEEQRWLPREKQVNTLPNCPKQTATNDKRLLDVLHLTARCVDTNNVKTALNGVCLRGATLQILGTSGIQLLVHEHFAFPWKQDIICPVSKVFGAKELHDIDTDEVLLGQVNDWVYFGIGEVEIWLRAIEGTFPKVEQLIIPAKNAVYLNVHPTDAAFILDRIDKLPGGKEHESPVHLVLEDKIQIRAYDKPQKCGTTLELTHSACTERNIRLAMNRLFLKNALQFGCLRIGIVPNDSSPVLCTGEEKTFVFMPLSDTAEPEIASGRMEIVASTATTPATTASAVPAPVKRRRRRKVAPAKHSTATPSSKAALLSQAEEVRQALRTSLIQVNTLIKEVKAQRSKDKLIQTTMDSLRKLNLNIV